MKIAIMQPYFFPYLGYFDLINNVDLFIVFDSVQHIRRGWIHRNRVLHQNGNDWQYIIAPTEKAHQKASILDIRIIDALPWQERILSQLTHYRNAAPYAEQTIKFVSECLIKDEPSLSRLNTQILKRCTNLLGIKFHYQFCSDLKIKMDPERSAEERILDLCEFLGAKEYINLSGGTDLYHPKAFESRNIKLTFRSLPTFVYPTEPYVFESNLSVIDLLMWNKSEDIKKYLDEYRN